MTEGGERLSPLSPFVVFYLDHEAEMDDEPIIMCAGWKARSARGFPRNGHRARGSNVPRHKRSSVSQRRLRPELDGKEHRAEPALCELWLGRTTG